MTTSERPALPGDRARASVLVEIAPALAFAAFTEDIDRWWRRGRAYRSGGGHGGASRESSVVHLEPRVGGRLFETIHDEGGDTTVHTGTVTAWEPPHRLAFEWRAVNFAPDETTRVEVLFEERSRGTLVTVTHEGFASLRADHPVRHGQKVEAFVAGMGAWWGRLLMSLREEVATRRS